MSRAAARLRLPQRTRARARARAEKAKPSPGGTGQKASGAAERTPAPARDAERTPARGAGRSARRYLRLLLRLLTVACAFVLMVGFAVVLARLTLQPSPASETLTHTNLRPGRSLMAYLDQPELRDAARQIGGNLLLGVPFGVLVPVVAPKARGMLRVLLLTATVMLLVELVQGSMITGRAFDIDDVMLNSAGALAGYLLLGRRLGRAVHTPGRGQ
ncbi:VanZ family protein [Streptomyces sp. NPDC056716]|uniref:VanZ family protein n=1 Tax=unclassified Streptomyces TaxID=2593676 RepID=UPI0036765F50